MHTVQARGILSAEKCMNVYRGCTHGCIYCDSRSVCYGMDHPFEDVAVKENAPELLDRALRGKKRRCMIHTGAMCDPYLPLEAQCRLTRRCSEIIARRGFGLSIQTKSDGILEDLDLLQRIARQSKCVAQMTLTTCDEKLCKILEPGVCGTRRRARALKQMTGAGIETVAWISPILPFLNDTEENLRGLLELCFDAGVKGILCWNMGVTLREGSREYFYQALDRHFPGLKREYARQYGLAYECVSPQSPRLMEIFHSECEKRGVMHHVDEIFRYLHEFPAAGEQLSFFWRLPDGKWRSTGARWFSGPFPGKARFPYSAHTRRRPSTPAAASGFRFGKVRPSAEPAAPAVAPHRHDVPRGIPETGACGRG